MTPELLAQYATIIGSVAACASASALGCNWRVTANLLLVAAGGLVLFHK